MIQPSPSPGRGLCPFTPPLCEQSPPPGRRCPLSVSPCVSAPVNAEGALRLVGKSAGSAWECMSPLSPRPPHGMDERAAHCQLPSAQLGPHLDVTIVSKPWAQPDVIPLRGLLPPVTLRAHLLCSPGAHPSQPLGPRPVTQLSGHIHVRQGAVCGGPLSPHQVPRKAHHCPPTLCKVGFLFFFF